MTTLPFSKIYLLGCLFCIVSLVSCSQGKQGKVQGESLSKEDKKGMMENKENRVSPAISATQTINENIVTVNYSAPKVKGRVIWGGLVPYNQIWRAGANEATTLQFTKDVLINGQLLKKNTYSLFVIPTESEWIIIFNLNATQWGAFKYNEAEDALRIAAMPVVQQNVQEELSYRVTTNTTNDGGAITLSWDKLNISFNFTNAPEK